MNRPTRITVLRQLGGIGDFIMLTPVFRGLKEKYADQGGCRITLATSWSYMGGSLPMMAKHNPFIDEVVRVELTEFCPGFTRANRWDFKDVPRDNPPLCVTDTDMVIDLNVICSVVETDTMPNVTEHRTDIWCRHAAGGVTPSSKKPIFVLTPEELEEGRRWADEHLGEGVRIGLVMRANDPVRDWPHTRFFAFDLIRAGYKPVTIDAGMRLDTRGWELEKDIAAINGKNIRQTAAIVHYLDAVVTPDTGILHVAGAVGTPVVGLFGSTNGALRMREYVGHYTDPRKLVECSPCWYLKPCLKKQNPKEHAVCMARITPTLVMHELELLLERFDKCLPASGSSLRMV